MSDNSIIDDIMSAIFWKTGTGENDPIIYVSQVGHAEVIKNLKNGMKFTRGTKLGSKRLAGKEYHIVVEADHPAWRVVV